MRGTEPPRASDESTLTVRLPDGRVLGFSSSFHIGREPGCEIQLDHTHVSRRHAEVLRLDGQWIIRDLRSSNGVFVDGKRVDAAPIGEGVTITLGADGPMLQIDPEARAETAPAARAEPITDDSKLLDAYARRYFDSKSDEPAGGQTLMIRKAFKNIQEQQRRRQRVTIAAVALVALCAAGYALYEYRLIRQQDTHAQGFFYAMKAVDVQFAQLEQRMAQAGHAPDQQQVNQYMAQRRQMESEYESYVARLYDRTLGEKERLILRVTRLFGECDVAAPPDYVREVMRYIGMWQSTGRFKRAVKLAQDLGYPQKIAAAFIARDLPPQYFYLAMQESDFQAFRSGPPTRWGYAKGMWQFIPETGRTYGLKIGPLESVPRPDPDDDRFNWEKATVAAARYVKDIYATDAQASGLLVMASYNWGEHRVIDLLRKMPADPRERNFWKLLEKHRDRLPPETYNYVFSIVSAAVIGENPRLFGFQFDSPLKFLGQH
jgi:pSer/pThr/pTyr-binding forkhead associated (FHA) protein